MLKMKALDKSRKAIVITDDYDDSAMLFSYDTFICKLVSGQLVQVSDYWDYSRTTMKHLKMFIDKYARFNYVDKKEFEKRIEEL